MKKKKYLALILAALLLSGCGNVQKGIAYYDKTISEPSASKIGLVSYNGNFRQACPSFQERDFREECPNWQEKNSEWTCQRSNRRADCNGAGRQNSSHERCRK